MAPIPPASADLNSIFPGASEMATLMRAHDWAGTPLGHPSSWPDALKIPLRVLLTSRFEMWLGWGEDIAFFYNDAYRPTLGQKHPNALAVPARVLWQEIWGDISGRVMAVMERGETTWDKALLLLLERNGYPEETYHTFSYSPLHNDDGSIGGLMCIVTEETDSVIGERRLDMLRDLASGLATALTKDDVLSSALASLARNNKDFPFSLIYLFDEQRAPVIAGQAPVGTSALAAMSWPHDQLDGTAPGITVPLPPSVGEVPHGAWSRPATHALLVPIPAPVDDLQSGFMVLGINPHKTINADYQAFASLIAGQIAAGLAKATAFESERERARAMSEAADLRREAAEALLKVNETLAEQVAERTQERDRIWRLSQELMGVINFEGALVSVNPAWERLLGWKPHEILHIPVLSFVHPDDVARTLAEIGSLGSGDTTHRFDNRLRTRDGDYRWIRWAAIPTDAVAYAVGRDVTDEKMATDQLSEANRALVRQIEEREKVEATLRQMQRVEAIGQLTGGIAHDFNNMLAVVTGGLTIAQRRIAKGERDIGRFIAAALEGADRAATLTQRLLAFSRQQPLAPKVIEVNRMLAGMSDLLERSLGEQITIELVGAARLWRAHADPNQLENVILNLAVNARDAMVDGGRLTIETANMHLDEAYAAAHPGATPGQYVMLAVTDTGTGMTPEVLRKAFDPFFTTKAVGKGTGLGLSQVYGFVRQSGGHIDVYSEVGVGTTVKIYLPRFLGEADGDAAIVQSKPPEPSQRQATELVLVVEDEDRVRHLSVEALKELGYRVLEADGPMAALRVLDAYPDIDLLFTDVVMPEMNGRKLADEALKRRPNLKVLYTTGYTRNAVVHNGVLDTGTQLLPKPFSIDQLARKLRDVLDV